jgi:hypothetical protein
MLFESDLTLYFPSWYLAAERYLVKSRDLDSDILTQEKKKKKKKNFVLSFSSHFFYMIWCYQDWFNLKTLTKKTDEI